MVHKPTFNIRKYQQIAVYTDRVTSSNCSQNKTSPMGYFIDTTRDKHMVYYYTPEPYIPSCSNYIDLTLNDEDETHDGSYMNTAMSQENCQMNMTPSSSHHNSHYEEQQVYDGNTNHFLQLIKRKINIWSRTVITQVTREQILVLTLIYRFL
ncbi:uncharacterized protein LOC126895302 [Daktulosphaira vitifoliae]|uniref:uncharacterized protein LOC126895302 n=1 Tax=Daktulosphaira vitifoliae TaxID=58002 RepID=UPI0021AA1182|nr:uncharacterized protein LOC126895302 [Daktulosphaira vitifoliae]